MDKKQLLLELEKSVKEYNFLVEKKSMIMLAIYEKSIAELKERKLKELNKYFENQVKFYEQDYEQYQLQINKNKKEYKKQLENLIKIYNYLYTNTFKSMEKALGNQIETIGNLVELWNKNEPNSNKKIIAMLQKKVNYSVIIEECKARLNWCIEYSQRDIERIFKNDFYQMTIYKKGFEGFLQKIKRKVLNFINGKKQIIEVLNKYENETLKTILEKNELKILEIVATSKGVEKQIKDVEKQINFQYDRAMQKA